MLSEIRVKDNGFYTGVPNLMHNASNGTLNTFVCALPDDELEHIAEDAGVPENSMDALLAGDSVLLRWGDCYYDPLRMNIIRASNRMAVRRLNRSSRPVIS